MQTLFINKSRVPSLPAILRKPFHKYAALAALILLLVFAIGCSDTVPTATNEKKSADVPSPPITGRQALQYMMGSARIWAPDAQPLTIRGLSMPALQAEPGKASAWEVIFVSTTGGTARTFTWSAIEGEGIHKGVFGSAPETWRPKGAQQPFSPAQLKIDTPEALDAAIKESSKYLDKPGKKPPVNFMLELDTAGRFQSPVWHVMWGGSISSAEFVATVDAVTGKVVGL